jgi:hypothetical protein
LAIIALTLISLVGFIIINNIRSTNRLTDAITKQSTASAGWARDETLRLQGQLSETIRRLDITTDRAAKSEYDLISVKQMLGDALLEKKKAEDERDDAVRDREAIKHQFSALKAYVILLVKIMQAHQIEVPPMEGILQGDEN